MADDGSPAIPPSLDPGSPRFAWFDGIVEGRLGDAAAVRGAAQRANASGFGRMDVGVDGGRFSVLMDDTTVTASRMTDENRRVLANALSEIATAAQGPLESTLRCTEVFQNEVRETLFLSDAGTIRALTRTRPVSDADLHRNPEIEVPSPSMGRGRLAVVMAVLLLAFGLVAWRGGWVDRLLSAPSETLQVDTGPFADFLEVRVAKDWGNFKVTVRRGAGFPVSNERLAELRAKATTPSERAAVEAVASGGEIWLRLEDAHGHGLSATRAELRALVAAADRVVEADLPGRISASRLRLGLDAGVDIK